MQKSIKDKNKILEIKERRGVDDSQKVSIPWRESERKEKSPEEKFI